jgi:hypothetical protein
MLPSSPPVTNWKWCALVSLAMVLLSLAPQFHLWLVRGREWNGAYVSPQGDEPLYSAYVNSLIQGRPRKNDPFGGTDNSSTVPLPESTFSIQFFPAYLIALPARGLGVSASTAFIILLPAAALFASISVFWLLIFVTRDTRFAAAGTLLVLCLGCIVERYGLFGTFFDIGIPALPFLRRYQPAAAFPLFFIFQLLVWQALTSQSRRAASLSALWAGLILAVLVYSYLYLWTGAAAWLACIGILWVCIRPVDRLQTTTVLISIGSITLLALIPYVYLLTKRPATLDEQQTLISTHRPDLLRPHEILGSVILITLVYGIRRGRFVLGSPHVIYAASLALLPFVVFNQQILTGKTMQSFHFEIFVVNYSILVSFLATVFLFRKPIPRRFLGWVAGLSLAWGIFVVALPARLIFVPLAVANDKIIPVLLRLKELSEHDRTNSALRASPAPTLVFSTSVEVVGLLPTWSSQGTLLDSGGVDFGSVTREERKRFFYMHLYYSQAENEALRRALSGEDSNPMMDRYARSMIFGHDRITPALSFDFVPIEEKEVDQEVQAYQTYANSFSRAEALKRPLAFAVVPIESRFDFANLDRWYERDSGEQVDDFIIYRLKMRN